MTSEDYIKMIEHPMIWADSIEMALTIKAAILRTMRIVLKDPEQANKYYNSQPTAICDEIINPTIKSKMVTREFLLANGFDFRVWDGSQIPEGEYTLRDKGWIIRIGWSRMFAWDIINYDEHIYIKADGQDNISIEQLRKILDAAKIELKLIEK